MIEHGAALSKPSHCRGKRAACSTTFCAPFDDPAVIAGQGTLGLELLDDVEQLSQIIVPLGGGGLASGVAIAVKSVLPHVRIVGVQASVCAVLRGLRRRRPRPDARRRHRREAPRRDHRSADATWVDDIVTVSEDAIAGAMVLLMDRAKLVAEGAGAVGVAALIAGAVSTADHGVTCVVLSVNVDLGLVPGLIRRARTKQDGGCRSSLASTIDPAGWRGCCRCSPRAGPI